MENFERRKVHNLIKPLIASPPDFLRVNEKNEKPYDVPNICAATFMSNQFDALHIARGDRRLFVSWNESEPAPASHFDALVAWFEAGGARLAAPRRMVRGASVR